MAGTGRTITGIGPISAALLGGAHGSHGDDARDVRPLLSLLVACAAPAGGAGRNAPSPSTPARADVDGLVDIGDVTHTDSGHDIYLYNPALVAEQIQVVVNAVRNGAE